MLDKTPKALPPFSACLGPAVMTQLRCRRCRCLRRPASLVGKMQSSDAKSPRFVLLVAGLLLHRKSRRPVPAAAEFARVVALRQSVPTVEQARHQRAKFQHTFAPGWCPAQMPDRLSKSLRNSMGATSVVMTEDIHNDSRLTRPVSLMAFRLLACWTLKG